MEAMLKALGLFDKFDVSSACASGQLHTTPSVCDRQPALSPCTPCMADDAPERLPRFSQAIVVGEECDRAKPHPDPYLDAAKLIGLGIDEVFAVEDSPSGTPGHTNQAWDCASSGHLRLWEECRAALCSVYCDAFWAFTPLDIHAEVFVPALSLFPEKFTAIAVGIQAAVAAEIPVIALTVGHPRAKLEAAGATHTLDDWFQLAVLVQKTQE